MKKKDPAKLAKFGDMSKAEQDARWENDPYELPMTEERKQRAIEGVFDYMIRKGESAEEGFPNDPIKQEAFRQYKIKKQTQSCS